AMTLQRLPLTFKPVKRAGYTFPYEYVYAWQNWYEQIKAGSRTFRFEGDPTEYDLNGPVPKEKLQRIERDRDDERAAGHVKSSPVAESGSGVTRIGVPASIAG